MASRVVKLRFPETEKLYQQFVEGIEGRILDPKTDRDVLCRDVLTDIYFPGRRWDDLMADRALSPCSRATVASLDPRNVTLEPEYYAECDLERYYRVKPLIWMWIMYDRSPLGQAGQLGFDFRRMLARNIFRRCGRNLKIWQYVEVSFGYNITVGDDCVFHRYVLLDDRGEIVIGNGVSMSDYVNVYSHSHEIEDINDVSLGRTVIGDGVRLTYHSVVLSDRKIGENAMLGTMAVLTRDIEPHHIHVGIPAKSVKVKKAGLAGPKSGA